MLIYRRRGHRSREQGTRTRSRARDAQPSGTVNCGLFAIIEGRLNVDKPLVNARSRAVMPASYTVCVSSKVI